MPPTICRQALAISPAKTKRRMRMRSSTALLLRESAVDLTRRDAIPRPRTFDAEAMTIEAVIASTTPVRRRDARGDFMEILDPAGLDLGVTRGASVLDSHQQAGIDNVLGTIDDVWIDGSEVVARLRFSSRPEIAPVVTDIRNGIIRNLSVGYEVGEWKAGKDAAGVRTMTAIRWSVREASFVAVPADPTARTRAANDDRAIRELGRRAGVATDRVNTLIECGASIDDARRAFLNDMLDRSVTVRSAGTANMHNVMTLDNPEVFQRAAADAMYTRIAPNLTPMPQARQYVGMSCADIARECLHRAGISPLGLAAPTVITRALQTTSDYPALLANLMNKSLREAYQIAPSGIRRVARQTEANDFRAKSRIQIDHSGFTLDLIDESAEYPFGAFIDSAESYSVATYGKIVAITRKALVNDDLGGLGDVTQRLGLAAAEFERQKLVDLIVQNSGLGPTMSDSLTLFHASHGNVGTGGVPSETTLSEARLLMRNQTGPGGGGISVVPRYLIVPSALETSAEKLITSVQATQTANVNPFAFLDLIVEPRLADTHRWYLTADPALLPCIEFAYLAGAPGPQTESRAGFEVDGVQTKVRLDYGCGAVEWRGLVTNAGQ
ncbi:HK97 family phage prohead protease [Bradyrhizobium sp. 26S5]|uniref:phage major capsid protein n=1 Tax=Bradyrhizobium sp. 26S5 TaxID=3139729 RepID=UPI0030D55CE4